MAKLSDFVKSLRTKYSHGFLSPKASIPKLFLGSSLPKAGRKRLGRLLGAHNRKIPCYGLHAGKSAYMTCRESSSGGASNDEHELKDGLPLREGKDHVINWRRGLSWKKYPKDCPSLSVQWFHAVDVWILKSLVTGLLSG